MPPTSATFRATRFSPRGLALVLVFCAASAHAAILWSDPHTTLAHETGDGQDILHGAAQRDDTSTDTLYFKFRVDPLSPLVPRREREPAGTVSRCTPLRLAPHFYIEPAPVPSSNLTHLVLL